MSYEPGDYPYNLNQNEVLRMRNYRRIKQGGEHNKNSEFKEYKS